MKLSKVQRVIETFELDNPGDYDINKLDMNRVPNPDVDKEVTLLIGDGIKTEIFHPCLTRYEAEHCDLKAVLVRYSGAQSRKLLLIN